VELLIQSGYPKEKIKHSTTFGQFGLSLAVNYSPSDLQPTATFTQL
jgi:hypothetical protein